MATPCVLNQVSVSLLAASRAFAWLLFIRLVCQPEFALACLLQDDRFFWLAASWLVLFSLRWLQRVPVASHNSRTGSESWPLLCEPPANLALGSGLQSKILMGFSRSFRLSLAGGAMVFRQAASTTRCGIEPDSGGRPFPRLHRC